MVFWADPPACTVGEPRKSYLGERSFPLILQNVHRYFLYLGMFFICILTIDAIKAFRFADPATGAAQFGIGVGSLVLTANTISWPATPSAVIRSVICSAAVAMRSRSRRHSGRATPACPGSTAGISCSRGAACSPSDFADLYVRLCSMGIWTDVRIL